MAREPSLETERAKERQQGPDAPGETVRDADLSPPPGVERGRAALERASAIARGRQRNGYIVLRTPLRRAVFIAGLLALVVLGLIFLVLA